MSSSPKTPFDDLDPREVLKPADIAARLHIDARSVRRAIARGDLPASRVGGLRVLAGDAAAWWCRKAVQPEVGPPADVIVRQVDEPKPRRVRSSARRVSRGERLPLPARRAS